MKITQRHTSLMVLSAALIIGAGPAWGQAGLSFSPTMLNLTSGQSELVEIRVAGLPAEGLAAIHIELVFDPLLVSVTDPNGGFTGSVEPFAPLGADPLCTTVRGTPTCEDPPWQLTSSGRSPITGLAVVDGPGGAVTLLTGTLTGAAAVAADGAVAVISVTGVSDGSGTVTFATSALANGAHPPEAIAHVSGNLMVNVGAISDMDGDGVADSMDNCILDANANQRDTNGDGYGNLCDADINNDGIVNVIDLGLFKTVFFTNDGDADFNGDGIVNVIDLGILKIGFFQPPGPSGLNP